MNPPSIARHRTALRRHQPSRPIRLALEDGIITEGASVFDYGCGLGDDMRLLRRLRVDCSGWDPIHQPTSEQKPSDVVNLGYVLNVIESVGERIGTLQKAWELSKRVLIVAARLTIESSGGHREQYGDGYLTRIGTFQKYFEQSELRQLIESGLAQQAVAAGPGVFYVFRDSSERETFLARKQQRVASSPRLRKSEVLYQQHKELLDPLVTFVSNRGRLPAIDELPSADAILSVFGTLRQALAVIRRAMSNKSWIAIRLLRSQDLLVYLALARFHGRAHFSELPRQLQLDVRAFFSTYKAACQQADALLFSAGDLQTVDRMCRSAKVGKETPSALYVHISALNQLPPILRVYEGCASAYIGDIEGTNVVKLHRKHPAVSYLSYPSFDGDPHPSLVRSLIVFLDGPTARYRDYSQSENPPILHRKEELLALEHPMRQKFERLTRQEERWNLYADTSSIGTRDGWRAQLTKYGLAYRGHRLIRIRPGSTPATCERG